MKKTDDEKKCIDEAIVNLKYAAIRYYKEATKESEENMMRMQNKLYDAIGGMDDYKFEIEED